MQLIFYTLLNGHWRIEGEVFFADRNRFVDEAGRTFLLDDIKSFLNEKGIAFYDTATAVRRLQDNASDKFLEVVVPTDVDALLAKLPHCRAIMTTGEKATEVICRKYSIQNLPKVGAYIEIPNLRNADGVQIILYRLPSSSRAYPLAFSKKVEEYRRMFEMVGVQIFTTYSSTPYSQYECGDV